MNTILKWGAILGLLVTAWTYIVGFAGWYKDPTLQALFWVVVLIEIVVLVLALRETAGQGRTYGQQVGAGTSIALVGGVIIFIGSYLFTSVVLPDYFTEVRTAGEEALRPRTHAGADHGCVGSDGYDADAVHECSDGDHRHSGSGASGLAHHRRLPEEESLTVEAPRGTPRLAWSGGGTPLDLGIPEDDPRCLRPIYTWRCSLSILPL